MKITPYIPGAGCLCSLSLAVEKDAIASISRTDETHLCCGKQLSVVTVSFADATVGDIFQQLINSAGSRLTPADDRRGSRSPRTGHEEDPLLSRMGYSSPGAPNRLAFYPPRSWPLLYGMPEYGRGEAQQTRADCLNSCMNDMNDCMWNCARMPGWAEYCACECRNMFRLCIGYCGLRGGQFEYCPPP